MEAFIGTILAWPIDFEPVGWLFCKGQTLNINQYQALYSLIGNKYGGDGRTTFMLPNLSGRVIVGAGQSAGTSSYITGQTGGAETVTLTTNQLPIHSHPIPASTEDGSTNVPGANTVMAKVTDNSFEALNIYKAGANTTLSPTGNEGQNAPHANVQPYLAMNYIICINGYYPSRY
ncbi:microcystin-dependent protein [Kineothrix alysoides]|uniref:Microcystin-dependent protein n=1 Tax=Kineothrix alysoides TaxID=1469948 RepID=A0A4R1QPZ0_9FIRM|nr:tail fiber protein [Kineothrix alysoides]TCL54981.1 microcystin-dependent protein [Kineothrix alysoides]